MNYYEIAKTAYCTEGSQWDCRDCKLINVLIKNNYDAASCRKYLIQELVKQIEGMNEQLKDDN
ncbi:MAG: hypothetical protein IIT65_02475 [Lachnospiraceae bacterium]|nr:hypothetical protein [Lachnospiraceae bacterium]